VYASRYFDKVILNLNLLSQSCTVIIINIIHYFQVLDRQEEEHKARLNLIQAQLKFATEQHELQMEVLQMKKNMLARKLASYQQEEQSEEPAFKRQKKQ